MGIIRINENSVTVSAKEGDRVVFRKAACGSTRQITRVIKEFDKYGRPVVNIDRFPFVVSPGAIVQIRKRGEDR